MQRDQLPDEERVKRACRAWAGREEALLGADEAHLDATASQPVALLVERSLSRGVCDDEVGVPERRAVDRVQSTCGKRRRPEPRAVRDECVEQRHERIEHDRPSGGRAACRQHIGMARVADQQRVHSGDSGDGESQLRTGKRRQRPETGRPRLAAPVPDRRVTLDDLDAGSTQARSHLGVARVVTLIRPEREYPHGGRRPLRPDRVTPGGH